MSEQQPYKARIDEVVHGFTNVWIKFESMLPAELARIQFLLEGISPEKTPVRDSDYELFYRVGSVLSRKESMTMGEFSSTLSIPLSKATRIVDWLVSEGYVERNHDLEDRRVVRINLTQKGKELHEMIENIIRERVKEILSSLTIEERDTLFRLVGKVVSSLGIKNQ